jgi:hypothetical protein
MIQRRRPARIAKLVLVHNRAPDPRRLPAHRVWMKLLPCLCCGRRPPCDPGHLRFNAGDPVYKGAAGKQPPDWLLIPICRDCHNREEREGKLTFWGSCMAQGISDPIAVAGRLRKVSGDVDKGFAAIAHARPGLPTAMAA